ncbi:protein kinase domain protein [Ichthyophthirius multifiliis]|uniref:Protein kinase domain protein n=1 Tax=Ichthyophthirius multifiliis TaxID=5932 RepID=G0QJ89_ICHMU|nr:protein kinase domain protein [Ichthyophthirius multifiliis]EGR34718.1 protein kinase domain protein [Ichthyophthirius multifiliis]|eukprot:XP_004040022.1 protein kinase domain protein [Ichthyophthirius multifiliis]
MGFLCFDYNPKSSFDFKDSKFRKSLNEISVLVIGDNQVGKGFLMSSLIRLGQSLGPGQEKFRYQNKIISFQRLSKSDPEYFRLNDNYLNEADVVLVCVDLSNKSTIENCQENFFEIILSYITKNTEKEFRCIVVGCKSDLLINQQEEESIQQQCRNLRIPYISVSSLKNKRVTDLLNQIQDFKNININKDTVQDQISIIQTQSIRSQQPQSQQQKPTQHNRALNQVNLAPILQPDEESKIDTQLMKQGSHVLQNTQRYIRIIPHEKMYVKNRLQLDKGNFGIVYKIMYENEYCALKICKIEMNDDSALNRFQIIFSEAENMQKFMLIKNMRIMPLKGMSFQVDMQRQNVLIGYWMPLCKCSLKKLIKDNFNDISIAQKIFWSLQLIESLEIFNEYKIQHMDLKPQNILLDLNDDIIVSDLSMSKVYEEIQTEAFNMLGTTAKYAHPAAIINHELSPRFDIYSFGCILLELFTGKQPWGSIKREELKEIYQQILSEPEKMNTLVYHKENYPNTIRYIEGKFQPIQDIINMCCVQIFIKQKKDEITIENIKKKFLQLQETLKININNSINNQEQI